MQSNSIKARHDADIERLGRERNARKKALARKERAATRAANAPAEVQEIDLALYRIKYLKMAARMVTKPGELFTKFIAIAEPMALIPERLCNRINWRVNKPDHWADLPEFDAYFGLPGDPSLSAEDCGLDGHLFNETSAHDSASLIEYIDQWVDELESRRAAIVEQHTTRIDYGGATGAFQSVPPNWA